MNARNPSTDPPGGYLALIAHAHLPLARDLDREGRLEEEWLYEAITETYLPLLSMFDRLSRDGVPFRMTMTLTPTLITMARDPIMIERYLKRLDRLIALATKETARTKHDKEINRLAERYLARFQSSRALFVDRYDSDLVGAFKKLSDSGMIEIMASAATHGYLPALGPGLDAARAQIEVGLEFHNNIFNADSTRGFWLPECGYVNGVEEILESVGIEYFIVDAHGALNAMPAPRHGSLAPIRSGSVYAFARDPESSQEVWNARVGYPGAPEYRDFYRDIGFDLELDQLDEFIHAQSERRMTSIKYYKITDGGDTKGVYDIQEAIERARLDAKTFCAKRIEKIDSARAQLDRPPLIVAPYDAELFGHWWYEGPRFLEFVARAIDRSGSAIEAITLGSYIDRHPQAQEATPAESSWGEGGYSGVWLDESNSWMYRHLGKALARIKSLARQIEPDSINPITKRALNQMARELLLAQSSDWAFMMKTGSFASYATDRAKRHIDALMRLYDQISSGSIDLTFLEGLERANEIFPDIDYRLFDPERSGRKKEIL